MGIFDFMKKGVEKPVEKKPAPTPTPGSPQQGTSAQSGREYTIKSGDSLSKIAKQFYGNAADWQKIYNANKDQIKNPDMIFPGQKIKIP
jgi:nucleoid-associated protein YgaU